MEGVLLELIAFADSAWEQPQHYTGARWARPKQ